MMMLHMVTVKSHSTMSAFPMTIWFLAKAVDSRLSKAVLVLVVSITPCAQLVVYVQSLSLHTADPLTIHRLNVLLISSSLASTTPIRSPLVPHYLRTQSCYNALPSAEWKSMLLGLSSATLPWPLTMPTPLLLVKRLPRPRFLYQEHCSSLLTTQSRRMVLR